MKFIFYYYHHVNLKLNDHYFWFDFWNLKCEVNTCCCPWYWFSSSWNTPADTESVTYIKFVIIFTKIINTVQPAVVILPCLKKEMRFHSKLSKDMANKDQCTCTCHFSEFWSKKVNSEKVSNNLSYLEQHCIHICKHQSKFLTFIIIDFSIKSCNKIISWCTITFCILKTSVQAFKA